MMEGGKRLNNSISGIKMDLINKYLQEQTPGHEYEYDYEGDMAKTQLNMMIDASTELKSMLANDTNLPEWVQSKITKAADYIDSARDYMKNMNKDNNGNMHNEPMGEEMKRDTGWKPAQTDRKDEYGNRIKRVARSLARQGMQSAIKDLKKGPEAGKRQVEEVEDLQELKPDTLNKYITRTRFSSDPKRRMGAQRAMAKVGQKPKEEKPVTEEIDNIEIEEAMRHKIAGAIGQFIGNKIDPVHGEIMRVHGEEAYRQAAYHIRKTLSGLHDTLKKHLSSGKLQTEEVESIDESSKLTLDNVLPKGEQINDRIQKHMDAADFHRNQARKIDAKDPNDIEGYNRHASLTDLHAKAFWSLRHHKKSPNGNHLKDYTATHKKIQSRYKKEPQLTSEEVEQIDEVKVGDKVSFNHPLAAAGGTLVKKTGTVHQIDGDTVHVKVKSKYGVMTHKTKASDLMKEELSSSQRDTHFSLMNKHGLLAKSAKGANKDAHRMAALDHQMALRNPENSQSRSKALSLSNKLGVKENTDVISKYTKLGEAKYPGFRVRMTSGGPKLPRRSYVPQGDQDPRTGLPLGFSNPPKSDKPETDKDKVKK